MKLYKKADLEFIDGMLVAKDGEIVNAGIKAVSQANELETMLQKAEWLKSQPSPCQGPDFSSFKRKSTNEIEDFVAETPLLDKKVAETMDLLNELDVVELTNKVNEVQRYMADLINFTKSDYVVSNGSAIVKFDVPTLGNPLEWDEMFVSTKIIEALDIVMEEK